MTGWTVSEVTALPPVSGGGPDDPVWYPLQHALGIDTFGANVFVAERAGQTLVEEHDERGSAQQELYLVTEGRAAFALDGETLEADAGTAIAVTDPAVRRGATALEPRTTLLVVGAGDGPFVSTWDPGHFAGIPRPG